MNIKGLTTKELMTLSLEDLTQFEDDLWNQRRQVMAVLNFKKFAEDK